MVVFFFKQKTAYEMRISDWSSDVCSSDLPRYPARGGQLRRLRRPDREHLHRELPHAHARRPRRAQLRPAHATRRDRGDLPVEPAAAADDLEGRAGPGLRQHRRGEAIRGHALDHRPRSEEHTTELQSLMRTPYADLL